MSASNWYVLKSKPRQELRALQELHNQDFNVFLPLMQVEKIRNGCNVVVAEPLFPGYLFIALNKVDSNWRALRSTKGTGNLLRFGDEPAIVPDPVIEFLQQRSDPAHIPMRRYLNASDPVLITDGPFRNFEALFLEYDGEKRAFLLLDMLGQARKLSFPLELVRLNN